MTLPNLTDLSIVVPMFNEEDCVEKFLADLYNVLEQADCTYEVIVVDDCSTDSTLRILQSTDYKNLRLISLEKNSGHSFAIWMGLSAARGDLLLTLDGDLQHPPSLIPLMIAQLRDSKSDITYGIRKNFNSQRLQKRLTSHAFYYLVRYLYGVSLEPYANDFRLIRKEVLNQVHVKNGLTPVLRAVLPSLMLPVSFVEFELETRYAGNSKFTLKKMIGLFINTASYSKTRRRLLLMSLFAVTAIIVMINFFILLGVFFGVFFVLLCLPFFGSNLVALSQKIKPR